MTTHQFTIPRDDAVARWYVLGAGAMGCLFGSALQRAGAAVTLVLKEPTGGVADAIVADIRKQMDEDRIIWARKKYFDKPMLCDNDGPFAKFRKWYGQFYAQDWQQSG